MLDFVEPLHSGRHDIDSIELPWLRICLYNQYYLALCMLYNYSNFTKSHQLNLNIHVLSLY